MCYPCGRPGGDTATISFCGNWSRISLNAGTKSVSAEIGVSRNEVTYVIIVLEAVGHHSNCDVYVGLFFFRMVPLMPASSALLVTIFEPAQDTFNAFCFQRGNVNPVPDD